MTRLLAALALAGLLAAATPDRTRPPRAVIVDLEKSFDGAIEKVGGSDPMEVMVSTQGVYVQGFGAVFTAQVDLIRTPPISPFRQKGFSAADKQLILKRKLERLPIIRQQMRQLLTAAAANLQSLPPNEQVVLAVSIFRYGWEEAKGLPAQIVMQAARSELMKRAAADNAIRTEEQ